MSLVNVTIGVRFDIIIHVPTRLVPLVYCTWLLLSTYVCHALHCITYHTVPRLQPSSCYLDDLTTFEGLYKFRTPVQYSTVQYSTYGHCRSALFPRDHGTDYHHHHQYSQPSLRTTRLRPHEPDMAKRSTCLFWLNPCHETCSGTRRG